MLLTGCHISLDSLFTKTEIAPYRAVAVQKGDTPYAIARRYDVNVRDLISVNHLKAPFTIYPGQGIRLPKKRIHIVRKFETIESISRDRHISQNELVRLNGLKPPYHLHENQRLNLPTPYTENSTARPVSLARPSKIPQTQKTTEPRQLTSTPTPSSKRIKIYAPQSPAWKQDFIAPEPSVPSSLTTSSVPMPPSRPPKTHDKALYTTTSPWTPPPMKPWPRDIKRQREIQKPQLINHAPSSSRSTSLGPLVFHWPLRGQIVSKYGALQNGLKNDGINIKAKKGAAIRASEQGTVVYTGNALKGYGNLILMRHRQGYITTYAHLQSTTIRKGQTIAKGKIIGYAGTTGNVKRPQLHFEIRKKRQTLDPIKLLK